MLDCASINTAFSKLRHQSFLRLRRVMYSQGSGIVNNMLDKIPVGLHIPGFEFCGTNRQKRLQRGDKEINPLDLACTELDIAYSQNRKDVQKRNIADRILAERAWERVLAKD